jgi:hypothetical protein
MHGANMKRTQHVRRIDTDRQTATRNYELSRSAVFSASCDPDRNVMPTQSQPERAPDFKHFYMRNYNDGSKKSVKTLWVPGRTTAEGDTT